MENHLRFAKFLTYCHPRRYFVKLIVNSPECKVVCATVA
jgi:hypothetical protein